MVISFSNIKSFTPTDTIKPEDKQSLAQAATINGFRGLSLEIGREIEQITFPITRTIWSNIIFKDGMRDKRNFESSSLLVFDFDSKEGCTQPRDLVQTLEKRLRNRELWYMIGSTSSHTDDAPALRVLVRCEEVYSLVRYEHMLKTYAVDLFEGIKIDPSPMEGARLWFPCKKILSTGVGKILPLLAPPVSNVSTVIIKSDWTKEFEGIKNGDTNKMIELWGHAQGGEVRAKWIAFLSACKEAEIPYSSIAPITSIIKRDSTKYEKQYNTLSPNGESPPSYLRYILEIVNPEVYQVILEESAKEIGIGIEELKIEPISLFTKDRMAHRFFATKAKKLDWLINKYILKDVSASMYSAGGVGKSFMSLDLALRVACARKFIGTEKQLKWLGKFPINYGGRVLYLGKEDPDVVLHQRIQNLTRLICEEVGEDVKPLIEENFSVPPEIYNNTATLFKVENAQVVTTPFYQSLLESIKLDKPLLGIFDTRGLFSGTDDCDNNLVTMEAQFYKSFCIGTGMTTLILGHVNKASSEGGNGQNASRGGTAWENTHRCGIYFSTKKDERDPNREIIIASNAKINYAAKNGMAYFQFEGDLEQDTFKVNYVLDYEQATTKVKVAKKELKEAAKLDPVLEFINASPQLTISKFCVEYAVLEGCSKDTARNRLNQLTTEKLVRKFENPINRKETLIELTPEGLKHLVPIKNMEDLDE